MAHHCTKEVGDLQEPVRSCKTLSRGLQIHPPLGHFVEQTEEGHHQKPRRNVNGQPDETASRMRTQEAGHLVHRPHFRRVDWCVQDDHAPRVEQEAAKRLNPLALKLLVNLVDAYLVQEDLVVADEVASYNVGAKQENDVENTGTTDSIIDALMLRAAGAVGCGERQPTQRADHAQQGGRGSHRPESCGSCIPERARATFCFDPHSKCAKKRPQGGPSASTAEKWPLSQQHR